MTVGEPFNPSREICGFYPPDIVSRNTELRLTDGQKRLYERGVRWAGRNGEFWYGFHSIAKTLGKSVRQVKDDMATLEAKGLMAHIRRRRQPNLYRFLWHPIFEVQPTAPQEPLKVQPTAHQKGDLRVQDSILEVQDSVKKGPLEVQPTALESCKSRNYVREESSSSASHAENAAQPNDDDPSKKSSQHQHPNPEAYEKPANQSQNQNQNQKPDSEARSRLIEEFRRALRLSRAETLRVPVEQVDAPDQTITTQILEVFIDFADAQNWVQGTIRRGLARKSRSATWGLWLEDAKNHEVQIRLDREAEEKDEMEAEMKRERRRAAEAEAVAELEIPVPWLEAEKRFIRFSQRDGLRINQRSLIIPRPLRVRFRRTDQVISPNELSRQAHSWKECPECKDGGILGTAVARDLRFCGCPAGVEAEYPPSDSERIRPAEQRLHKGPDWPAEEISRVYASTKSLLVAAYREIGSATAGFIARMIESAEVADDGKQITIHPANPKDTEWLDLDVLHRVMSRVGLAARIVEIAGIRTAAFDPAKQAAPPEPPRKQTAEAAPQVPEPERDVRGLCVRCGGPGTLPGGAFCSCQMGRDLETLLRQDKAQAAKKGPATEDQKGKTNVIKFGRRP